MLTARAEERSFRDYLGAAANGMVSSGWRAGSALTYSMSGPWLKLPEYGFDGVSSAAGELTEKAVNGGKAIVSETLAASILGGPGAYVSDPGGSYVAFRTISEKYGEIWLAQGERVADREGWLPWRNMQRVLEK